MDKKLKKNAKLKYPSKSNKIVSRPLKESNKGRGWANYLTLLIVWKECSWTTLKK
jgi:hypothetical protein